MLAPFSYVLMAAM